LSGVKDAIKGVSRLEISDRNDLSFREREEESGVAIDDSFTSFDDTDATQEEEVECDADHDLRVVEEQGSECEAELFGEEEVYFCGEVGCWKDSGWDSQMVNAREMKRNGMVKGMDEETESHIHWQRGEEVESPGVPEEYDRQRIEGETQVIFSETETAEQAAFGHILSFPTQRRPISFRREIDITATGIPTWFEASGIRLGSRLTPEEKQRAECLLYAWKDIFVCELREMPVTDLVEHQIPVHEDAKP